MRPLPPLAALVAVVIACGGSSKSGPPQGNVIKIAENDWTGALLNDAVAKQLLESQLGYTVELVPATTDGQFPLLATGDLHVSLELWPGGHLDEIAKYITTDKTVEDAGPLGVLAKDGWFVPTYMLDAHPELATWDGLKAPANVALFRTPDTGARGRFLSGDPSWKPSDQQILDNLGLDFTVVMAGSEAAEIAELDAAYQRKAPLLFYFWYPHWVMAQYDVTNVVLPPYSKDCWARWADKGVDCDYPTQHLTKIVWAGLKDYAPAAYRFLKAMNYSTKSQLDMLSAVQGGKSVDAVAREWIAANPTTWSAWVAAGKGQ